MDRAKIEKRISELKQMRERFIAQSNETLGNFNGRIAELEEMLKEDEAKDAPPTAS